eukprot:TRINITY_DN66982_c7_g1_i2.p1 TRINITY_DN66982_c7_g1~~TRINITY_DN66982_c7_g1_i2.p1  ORF type:complete len:103 (+),score=1.43 TRINITY_DN66982_c7_g1_i2:338-646(+)
MRDGSDDAHNGCSSMYYVLSQCCSLRVQTSQTTVGTSIVNICMQVQSVTVRNKPPEKLATYSNSRREMQLKFWVSRPLCISQSAAKISAQSHCGFQVHGIQV